MAYTARYTTKFLSTPSARRATDFHESQIFVIEISIHALREEGDPTVSLDHRLEAISIHALREEGDEMIKKEQTNGNQFLSTPSARRATILAMLDKIYQTLFLSTPSARRATAKTETKSLFSNKLYNILHEFRRALIYNGSKSYPNHAK